MTSQQSNRARSDHTGDGRLAVVFDAERIPFPEAAERTLADAGIALLRHRGHDVGCLDEETRLRVDAILVRHGSWGEPEFGQLPRLAVVARCGAGYDNIDVAAAARRRVAVTYVPDYGVDDVADQSVALGLAALRRISWSDQQVRAGAWPNASMFARSRRIAGATVGIVGLGRIGRATALRWHGFGARIVAFDPFFAGDPSPPGVKLTDLRTLLESSLIVSLHCPLTSQTHGLIGAVEIARMRTDSVLVNTGRAGLIDEKALTDALRSRRLGGAALDVLAAEPPDNGDDFSGLDNLVLTPHSAAFTAEAIDEVARYAAADVIAILDGRPARSYAPSGSSQTGGGPA